MGGSSSEVSAIVKSDSVATLIDGDCVTGVAGDGGIVTGSGSVTASGGEA